MKECNSNQKQSENVLKIIKKQAENSESRCSCQFYQR